MKKKVVLGIVVVVLVALVAAVLLMGRAPGLSMDGTYTAEDGTTLTVAGTTFTCSNGDYSGTYTVESFSMEYLYNYLPNGNGFRSEWGTVETTSGTIEVVLHEDGIINYDGNITFYAD